MHDISKHRLVSNNKCRVLFWSSFIALVALFLCNCLWNLPFTFGFGDDVVFYSSVFTRKQEPQNTSEAIFPINTAYDHTMIPIEDEFGVPIGEIDITNREKLLTLFRLLEINKDYKYIFCDIFFDKEYRTDSDSSLFGLMASMPRLVIPYTDSVYNNRLICKSALSDYSIYKTGDQFIKYQFLRNGGASVPLRMWEDLYGNTIRRFGPFFISKGRICNNSIILHYERFVNKTYSSEGKQELFYLGSDICNPGFSPNVFKDKVILIGDFTEDDMHDTMVGPMSGIMISFNAFLSLVRGDHIVPWYIYLLLFIVFFIYAFFILKGVSFHPNNKLLAFCLDWISFTVPLFIICWIVYYFKGLFINAIIMGTIFSLFGYTYQHLTNK